MRVGRRAGPIALTLVIATGLTAGELWSEVPSQQGASTGILIGQVADSAGRPVPRAEVTIAGRRGAVLTNETGAFQLATAAGPVTVAVRRLGYIGASAAVSVAANDTTRLRFALAPSAVLLDSMVTLRPLTGAMRQFDARRSSQQGTFITSAQLREVDDRPFRSVLGRYATGISLVTYKSGVYAASTRGMATVDPRLAIRAIPSDRRSPAGCWLQVYVDGTRLYAPNGSSDALDLSSILTRNVEAVEVYSGAANTPPEFGSSWAACGTLVLWTRLP